MFTLNRMTAAGAALLLAAIGCASDGAGGPADPVGAASSVEALPAGDAASGETLFSGAKSAGDGDDLGCASCHSLDGANGVGPSLKGLAARVPEGYDTAKAYIYESIVQPGADVRTGFIGDIMPGNFDKKLDDQALADLIAFLSEQ